ncbi:MAG TPA: hypothetical protein P5306_10595, partial [Kiritimatiellia bacterium]|nr:hypothetical protein [Kiritimatiellia bacterium]HRX07521.1 hypothetical protein [Kiritimatiellia bacterium]
HHNPESGFSTVWKKSFHGVENPSKNFPCRGKFRKSGPFPARQSVSVIIITETTRPPGPHPEKELESGGGAATMGA